MNVETKEEAKRVVRLIPLPIEFTSKVGRKLPDEANVHKKVVHGLAVKNNSKLKRQYVTRQLKLEALLSQKSQLQVHGKTPLGPNAVHNPPSDPAGQTETDPSPPIKQQQVAQETLCL